MSEGLSFLEQEQERLGFSVHHPPKKPKVRKAAEPKIRAPVQLTSRKDLEEVAEAVERIATPLTMYLLMWLASHPDSDWRSEQAKHGGFW